MKERLLKYWTEHYKSNTNALQFNEVAREECAATTVTEKTLKISTSFSQLTTYTGVDIEEGGWGLRKPPLTKKVPPPPPPHFVFGHSGQHPHFGPSADSTPFATFS